jgi:hypothetical protein
VASFTKARFTNFGLGELGRVAATPVDFNWLGLIPILFSLLSYYLIFWHMNNCIRQVVWHRSLDCWLHKIEDFGLILVGLVMHLCGTPFGVEIATIGFIGFLFSTFVNALD